MPSTYTTNTGIEKPGDGEQSGNWGDTVNENMDILDRALNGVGSISLSGTTHTLTTGDGTLSDGQYRVLVLGGAPSGTNTITVSPNDAQKLYFVVNNSGESVIFTQGSGGNVTISDGDSAIIYCDGGGGSAAVVDVSVLFVPNLGNAGVTASTSELHILDGVTANTAEINLLDGAVAGTVTNSKAVVYGAAGEVNATTLQVGGTSITASAADLNKLDGAVAGTVVNSKAVVYGASGEVNATTLQIDGTGITASAAELNLLDGSVANTVVNDKAVVYGPSGEVQAVTIDLGDWTISQSGSDLKFSYGGVDRFKLTSTGDLTVEGNITAYGSA